MTSQHAAPLACVRIDGDDFSDVVLEMERAFDISLPRDLRHISTVGDLFTAIVETGNPDGRGERCDTSMAFYRLRCILGSVGLAATAGPKTVLAGQALPSPKKVRQLLKAELGFESPGIVVSRAGCVLAGAIFFAAIGLALMSWSWDWLALWLLVLPVFALDRGDWKGDWETLGSLSRAIASRNLFRLAREGARNGENDWWRSFSHLLAGTVFDEQHSAVEARQLAQSTRFVFS